MVEASVQQEQPKTGLNVWQHVAIFLLACLVIISRRPDAVFHPQFWFEDGPIFYADAYNLGWCKSLFVTYQGYFHAAPRLGTDLALLVPFSSAPLVMNLIAIGIQALPANLLLSSRAMGWGNLRFRALLAVTFLTLPNCGELNATLTWSQWPLALSAFLLLVASPPRSKLEQVFDLCLLTLSAFSGPFCIFLLPIGVVLLWKYRDNWRWVEVGVLSAACLVQVSSLLNGGYFGRPRGHLGASPAMFNRLVGAQLYIGALIGGNRFSMHDGTVAIIVLSGIAIGGTIFVILCLIRSSRELRLFAFFSCTVLTASLISPTPGPLNGGTVWEALAQGTTVRYWVFPCLVYVWSILSCIRNRNLFARTASVILMCTLCFGVALRWRYFHFENGNFAEYASRFESAPAGTAFTFVEGTTGWTLRLVKHGSNR